MKINFTPLHNKCALVWKEPGYPDVSISHLVMKGTIQFLNLIQRVRLNLIPRVRVMLPYRHMAAAAINGLKYQSLRKPNAVLHPTWTQR